jgi:hypothetical protein
MEQPTNFMVVALFFDLSTFLIACISSFLVFRPFVALPVRCTAFLKVVLFPFLFHSPDCSYEEVEAEDDDEQTSAEAHGRGSNCRIPITEKKAYYHFF